MRLAMGLVAAGVVAANSGFAQHVDRHGPIPGLSPPEGLVDWHPAPRPAGIEDVARLQPSVTLPKFIPASRKRAAVAPARGSVPDLGETPELRLETNLRGNVPVVGTGVKPLPSGDLNPGGLVRASRMRIREGMIFLEGDKVGADDTVTLGGGR